MSGEVYLDKTDRELLKYLIYEIYKDYSGLYDKFTNIKKKKQYIDVTNDVITEFYTPHSIEDMIKEDLLFNTFRRKIIKYILKYELKYKKISPVEYNDKLHYLFNVSINKFEKLGYMKIEYYTLTDKSTKSAFKYTNEYKDEFIILPTNISKAELDVVYGNAGIFCLNNRAWFSKIKWDIIATVISIVSIFISIFK